EDEPAVADRDDALGQILHGVEAASAEVADIVDLGFGEVVQLQDLEVLPAADENAGLRVVEVGAEPAGRARAFHRVPGLAGVGGFEKAGGELIGAVGEEEADAVVDEANLIQSGQRVDEQP